MTLEIVSIVLSAICLVACIGILFLLFKNKGSSGMSKEDKQQIIDSFNNNIDILSRAVEQTQRVSNEGIIQNIKTFQENLTGNHQSLEKRVLELIKQLDDRMQQMSKTQENKLEAIRQSNERQMKALQEDNNKQLDKMRETVDEKLSKTINERFEQSFKVLSEQLESVYKSLGEMQNIASDVGNLTKMLSNVKTTGIFGEIQLGAILEQLLAKEQYETNIITNPNSKDPVEFAVKLPGQAEGEFVYLPIDSKFPYTIYTDMQNAYENNNFELAKKKKEILVATIKNMAKDINTKYIYPPYTTDFAIMFLPIEGLYAEVVKAGLIEELQNKYKVMIAGPTTMSALLNSLQMGFKTLALQKKSSEVWKILGAVRTEFEKYNQIVEGINKRFEQVSKDFDTLIGVRTRQIAKKLKSVELLDKTEATKLLELDNLDPAAEE